MIWLDKYRVMRGHLNPVLRLSAQYSDVNQDRQQVFVRLYERTIVKMADVNESSKTKVA
jgi:hypothetical protein